MKEPSYSEKVKNCTNMLLLMLDEELNDLEKKHQTGSYWRRLRVRKRLVQSILEFASLEPKEMMAKLRQEFFQKSDQELGGAKQRREE